MLFGCGGCLGLVILSGIGFVVLFYTVMSGIKANEPYKSAIATAIGSPEVQAELGAPIHTGFLGEFSVNREGPASGKATFVTPLNGPKGSGSFHYNADLKNGKWVPTEFTVQIDKTGKSIDLRQSPDEAQ